MKDNNRIEVSGARTVRLVELKVLSELMKDSKRSDRDLAKTIGISQPTVTRARRRLEGEGYIREYTIVPDFKKLGYEIAVLTFLKFERLLTAEELAKARKIGLERLGDKPADIVMIALGDGLGYGGVVVSIHKNYSSYMRLRQRIAQYSEFGLSQIETFMMNLSKENQFLPLTFSLLAKNLTEKSEE